MLTRSQIACGAVAALVLPAALFTWGQWVNKNDARIWAHDQRTQLAAAVEVCGAGAEIAMAPSGPLCIWHRADGGVYARAAN